MSDNCRLPKFDHQQAMAAARQLYGVEGEFKQLQGERDLNYLVTTSRGRYILKIANLDESLEMLDCQHQVFELLDRDRVFEQIPTSVKSLTGKVIETVNSSDGSRHFVRLVNYVEGRLLSAVIPHTPELLESLGEQLALLDKALSGFTHPAVARPLLWEMHNAIPVIDRFKPLLASAERHELVAYFTQLFKSNVLPLSDQLRRGVIHNDANDNNVLVAGDGAWNQRVVSIIDFGDMVESWIVADPAIAAAYAMLGKSHPLDAAASVISGYHRENSLTELEISALFELMCMRLCMSVCICAHQQSLESDNDYLRISEQPAWETLQQLQQFSPRFVHFVLRAACELEPDPNSRPVVSWLQSRQMPFAPIVDLDLVNDNLMILDTSVSSPHMGSPGESADPEVLSRDLFRAIDDNKFVAAIGRYDEYRLIYSSEDFTDATGYRRTLHLGIDIFMPAESAIYAPLAGVVHSVANDDVPLGYGGTLIIKHRVKDDAGGFITFYTLYGHLAPASLLDLEKGNEVNPGQLIARMGAIHENGYWPPHVHFEIITDMLDQINTFVGVGTHHHRKVWLSLCPDPNLILGIPENKLSVQAFDRDSIMATRRDSLNPSLSLSYRNPIHMARGALQYLYDITGQQYLDAVNNVPHVGHCHPRVVAAGQQQAGILNTNTRYLYSAIAEYSERLLQTFPQELSVCYLTCSGSEANDLALRMAWNHTGRRDLVILEHAYHGNLSALIDISPYKHDGKGGKGAPRHVHKAAIPDSYRGAFKRGEADMALNYAQDVERALREADSSGGAAALLTESMLGCGGQVMLPDGYLKVAYAYARQAGAVCIADEVQVGFGRIGSHFWAFDAQGVVPDIVTLGKPIGNGHPMAAVITTRAIADSFNNGMEYFNTFGGNPVSCAVGQAVLDVIEDEQLQQNAQVVGNELIARLAALQSQFSLIGDVRGRGLFIGVELVNDRDSLDPAHAQASYIAERMKQQGILISTDGPRHNVLKIKPPMCFNMDNALHLAATLESILMEDFAQPGGWPG